jgi:hypothetical protein
MQNKPNIGQSEWGQALNDAIDHALIDNPQEDQVIIGQYALIMRNDVTLDGLSITADVNGDVFISSVDAAGSAVNSIILRGTDNGSFVRFGPDTSNGIAVSPIITGQSNISIDGRIHINPITGAGMDLTSAGGGAVTLKPASFATDTPVQLLPDANGTVAIIVSPPATATSAGVVGMIAFDASWVYICTATNAWKRAGIAAW